MNNSSPRLEWLYIYDNYGDGRGGGICCNESSPTIENVFISNNSAELNGGGISCWYNSNPNLKNLTITNNSTNSQGGGIYCYESDPILENVVITNNTAIYCGGIYCYDSDPILKNVTIANNSANDSGGIFCYNLSNPSLVNCIMWNNTPEEVVFAPWSASIPSTITIAYSDIDGGIDAIVTNNSGTIYWLAGSIDTDPLFVDPVNGDYHLTENSHCIDSGDPNFSSDPDGTISDIGAYYYPHLNSNFSADPIFGYENLIVDFTNASESYSSHWYWDFESDGIYDDFTQNPSHFYDQPGIYDVTLKIEYNTLALVDSLMKSTYIMIQESQLLPPQNPFLSISGDDIILTWNVVIDADYYLIYLSDNPYGTFELFDYTTGLTTYTHTAITINTDHMFYFVIGFDGTLDELTIFIDQNQTMNSENNTK